MACSAQAGLLRRLGAPPAPLAQRRSSTKGLHVPGKHLHRISKAPGRALAEGCLPPAPRPGHPVSEARPTVDSTVVSSSSYNRSSGSSSSSSRRLQEGMPKEQQRSSGSASSTAAVTPLQKAAAAAAVMSLAAGRSLATAWPTLLRVIPKVVLAALIAAISGLFRPLPSLAHSGGAHVPAALASSAASSQWLHVVKAGWTGLLAGCLHTLAGPDHLVALAPLTIGRSRVESAAIGALWGCGHDAGQVLFGVLFVLMEKKLHLDILRVWGPRVVGLTLMAIGAVGIHEARIADAEGGPHHHHHDHDHDHDHFLFGLFGNGHKHGELTPATAGAGAGAEGAVSSPLLSAAAPAADTRKKTFSLATFLTGIVHGLQPDALLVVLPALAMPSRVAGASFLALFLLGTVLAMGAYTAFIGSCSDALRDRVPGITKKLSLGAAVLAIVLGICMLVGEFFGIQLL